LLDGIAAADADGIAMTGQVLTRPTGILLGFEISQHPFVNCPAYQPLTTLPFAQQLAALHDLEICCRLLAEATAPTALARRVRTWDRIFPLGDPPDYEPAAEYSMAAGARRRGPDPAALSNYAHGDLGTVREMMQHPNTLLGLGDGGAPCRRATLRR
jgi:N-acyl-D-aspartate/D-glutamate deacylase